MRHLLLSLNMLLGKSLTQVIGGFHTIASLAGYEQGLGSLLELGMLVVCLSFHRYPLIMFTYVGG